MSRSYLGDVEAGRSEPSGALLTSLTSTTDVSADWVLTGEGKMERGVPAEAAEEGGAYNVVETQLAARVRALVVALGSLDKIHQEAILAQAISRAELTRQVAELVTAVSKLEEHITRNGAR